MDAEQLLREPPKRKAVPGTCSVCRYWTPPTPVYYGTCHNTLAGLGAHTIASGDGWCKHYDAALTSHTDTSKSQT